MSDLRDKLRSDVIDAAPWDEIRSHVARVVTVHDLHLIDAGEALARDERDRVERWLEQGRLARPSADDLRRWERERPSFEMLIVTPWILLVERDR